MSGETDVDLAQLAERVEGLGRLVHRDDLARWIGDLDAAGTERRHELGAALTDPALRELVAIVDSYGGALVLAAVGRVAARLRRESLGLGAS